jgi:hypothetical protein
MVASLAHRYACGRRSEITGERRTHERVLERESSRLDDACAIGDAPFAGDSNTERRSNLWQ